MFPATPHQSSSIAVLVRALERAEMVRPHQMWVSPSDAFVMSWGKTPDAWGTIRVDPDGKVAHESSDRMEQTLDELDVNLLALFTILADFKLILQVEG